MHRIAPVHRPATAQLPAVSRSAVLRTTAASLLIPRSKPVMAMASGAPLYETWVKGWREPNGQLILGDCPFCHRALLTLEEKHIPYTLKFIDFKEKPQWIFKLNEKGSVPVMKDLTTGDWLNDSALIVDMLEDKVKEPVLGRCDSIPDIGSGVFPAFKGFLQASDEESSEKQSALEAELAKLSDHLQANGPYLKGENVSAGDLALTPKLYHLKIALEELKGYTVPAKYSQVTQYLDRMQQRDSWKSTYYAPEIVVAGWKKH